MAKATFPFVLSNQLERFIRELQLELLEKHNVQITWKQIYEDCGKFCGVSGHTISMIRAGSNNPSIFLAYLIAKYFKTTVDDIFGIVPLEGDINERLDNWKPCGLGESVIPSDFAET